MDRKTKMCIACFLVGIVLGVILGPMIFGTSIFEGVGKADSMEDEDLIAGLAEGRADQLVTDKVLTKKNGIFC